MVKARDEAMEDFNGPLDLILHLLSKNRMEIKDIQISLILDQYLEWMDQRKRLDLEVASEFVTMAAHLVFIKTRMLLSIHDEEAISEMEQLIASLEEHQRHENFAKIKAIVPELSDRYAIGRDYIPKVPEALPVNRTYRYVHKPEDLLRAMTARPGWTTAPRHPWRPSRALWAGSPTRWRTRPAKFWNGRRFGVTRFRALFKGNRSRSEVVATFIAVLELCKARRLRLAGTESDCTVTCTEEGGGELELTTDGEKTAD
ncbi:MAG: segregation and condensation protein A [Flavonifractor plautii]